MVCHLDEAMETAELMTYRLHVDLVSKIADFDRDIMPVRSSESQDILAST